MNFSKFKIISLGILIFLLFFAAGAALRLFVFASFQEPKALALIWEKDLAQSKYGGKTPQETWNLYLDALEKGNVDEAVQYWWPEKSMRLREVLNERKNAGVVKKYSTNHGRQLGEVSNLGFKITDKDERIFSYKYIREKEIEFIGAEGELRSYLESFWGEQQSNKSETEETVVFKLNPYTKKWLIKE